jgi:hypothetical protein
MSLIERERAEYSAGRSLGLRLTLRSRNLLGVAGERVERHAHGLDRRLDVAGDATVRLLQVVGHLTEDREREGRVDAGHTLALLRDVELVAGGRVGELEEPLLVLLREAERRGVGLQRLEKGLVGRGRLGLDLVRSRLAVCRQLVLGLMVVSPCV